MKVLMSFNSLYKNTKRDKYVNLHNKLKHQGKLFRKKYEVETTLNNREKEAQEYCNIFTSDNDTRCMDIFEDIENLEYKLKDLNKKLNCKKYNNKW